MPKPTRKRRSGSHLTSDFEKRKTKLGKGKQVANNATDTSFKARSIALPQQSISKDTSKAAPRTRRNLTVEDLLIQLRHTNANVRSDALAGLEEIHRAFPSLSQTYLGLVLPSVVRVSSDEDAKVRKAFLRFFTFYVAVLDAARIKPYAPVVVLHIGSAMSHIFPDVRIDAVKTMEVCLRKFGTTVISGWQSFHTGSAALGTSTKQQSHAQDANAQSERGGARILQCYLALLGISTSSRSSTLMHDNVRQASLLSTDISSSALVTILRGLHFFLSLAIAGEGVLNKQSVVTAEGDGDDCPTWMFMPSFSHEADRSAFERSIPVRDSNDLAPSLRKAPLRDASMFAKVEDCDVQHYGRGAPLTSPTSSTMGQIADNLSLVKHISSGFDAEVKESGGIAPNLSNGVDASLERRLALFDLLSHVLLNAFLEAAPIAFDPQRGSASHPSSTATPLQEQADVAVNAIAVVVAITLCLWRGVEQAPVKHCVTLAKLLKRMGRYFPMGSTAQHYERDAVSNLADEVGEEVQDAWMDVNLAYCELTSLLTNVVVVPDDSQAGAAQRSSASMVDKGHVTSVAHYVHSILHRAQSRTMLRGHRYTALLPTVWLLLRRGDAGSDEIVKGLLQHWKGLACSDSTKRAGTAFFARLLQLTSSASYDGRVRLLAPLSACRPEVVRWITESIPQYLWELNAKDVHASDVALEILRQVACKCSRIGNSDGLLSAEEIDALSRPFSAFFQINHARRGLIDGPYRRLPSSVQRRARAVLAYMPVTSARAVLFSSARAVGAI